MIFWTAARKKLKNIKLYHGGLLVLLALAGYLRFANLGYSEFQDDEKKVQVRLLPGETTLDFFMRQRKGPMQFFVGYLPFLVFNPRIEVNEFAVRLPFTLANLASVFVLYAFILKISKSHAAAWLTAALYAVNGFVVGFARIAQYQNLNLLFSLLALYFFADLKYKISHLARSLMLGCVFTSLSLLSHWDAVFYAVPSLYFLGVFIRRKDCTARYRRSRLGLGLIVATLIVLPFLIPYLINMASNQTGNIDYFFKRIGSAGSSLARHKFIFELYNPELALWVYGMGILVTLGFIKKTWMVGFWFGLNFLLLKLFMVTPKTHIYNYVIPAIILASAGYGYLYGYLVKKLRGLKVLAVLAFAAVALLWLQSYQIFVDHKQEYPFDAKKILWHQNTAFHDMEIVTFGFPHTRNWKVIDTYIDPACKYITNESKGISQIYVKALYGQEKEECFYIVQIKRPFYTKTGEVKYAGANDSKLVYKYVKNGETLAKVYRMR